MGGIQEFVADLTENKNCIFPDPIYVDKIYNYKRKKQIPEADLRDFKFILHFQF